MENVLIWLRTYVVDTLGYIEYECRALPIALLCNHFETKEAALDKSANTVVLTRSRKQSNRKVIQRKFRKVGRSERHQRMPHEAKAATKISQYQVASPSRSYVLHS
jgi:hypothetical protein